MRNLKLEVIKWQDKQFDLAETSSDSFSLLFGSYKGIQINKYKGGVKLSVGLGNKCFDLSITDIKKRPELNDNGWPENTIFTLGGKL